MLGTTEEPRKVSDGLYVITVSSDSRPGVTYDIVADTNSMAVGCECPSFVYSGHEDCKHIRRHEGILYDLLENVDAPEDPAEHLLRAVVSTDGEPNVVRVSNDNVDVLLTVLRSLDTGDALVVTRE